MATETIESKIKILQILRSLNKTHDKKRIQMQRQDKDETETKKTNKGMIQTRTRQRHKDKGIHKDHKD